MKNPNNKGKAFFESLNSHLLEIIKIFHRIDRYLKKKSQKSEKMTNFDQIKTKSYF